MRLSVTLPLLALTLTWTGGPRATVTAVNAAPDTLRLETSVDTGQATCAPTNQYGTPLFLSCRWASQNTTVARVLPPSGTSVRVVGVAAGSTQVVATVKGKRESIQVIVATRALPWPPGGIILPPPLGCIASAATICPGDNWQAKVDAAATGTVFTVGAGIHARQSVRPKAGQTFRGQPGAVMDGGSTLTGWTASGGTWYVGGQTQQGTVAGSGSCQALAPRCQVPEQLWVNGHLYTPQATLAGVGAATWYFDYAADRIYLGFNPTDSLVETSVTPVALAGTVGGVTIQGLTIRHYAAPFGHGAIDALGDGWTIRDNTITDNGGAGVRCEADACHVLANRLTEGGQWGVSVVGGTGFLLDSNEVDHNNTAGWLTGFGAGGMKLVQTTDAVVRHNNVHHNTGTGIWCDIDNVGCRIQANTVAANDYQGIFVEISYGALIDSNTVEGNGYGRANGTCFGAGILVAATPDVEIRANTVTGNHNGICAVQQARGTGSLGPHEIANLYVHDNTVGLDNDTYSGLSVGTGDATYYTTRNNRFLDNTTTLPAVGKPYMWQFARRTAAEWTAYGMD